MKSRRRNRSSTFGNNRVHQLLCFHDVTCWVASCGTWRNRTVELVLRSAPLFSRRKLLAENFGPWLLESYFEAVHRSLRSYEITPEASLVWEQPNAPAALLPRCHMLGYELWSLEEPHRGHCVSNSYFDTVHRSFENSRVHQLLCFHDVTRCFAGELWRTLREPHRPHCVSNSFS